MQLRIAISTVKRILGKLITGEKKLMTTLQCETRQSYDRCKNYVEIMEKYFHWVEVEKKGRNRYVRITDEGKEFFNSLDD